MSRNPPPVRFCHKHGTLLIRRHWYWMPRETGSYAADRVWEKEVPPRCVYESDGCAVKR